MTMSKSMPATEREMLVIKLGGSILYSLSPQFFESMAEMMKKYNAVIVHGGGPEITNMLEKLNIETTFINGQRKTTEPVLEIAEMVLKGKVNSYLTNQLNSHGMKAVGLCGYDAHLLEAVLIDEESLGLVGEIEDVQNDLLTGMTSAGYLPVIAPLALTKEGTKVNVNADLAAASIAKAAGAGKLLYVTDVPGVLQDGEMISEATAEEINQLIGTGVISGGMIPKVKSALSVLSPSLKEVMIVGGQQAFFQDGNILGTKITEKGAVAAS
ncbi:acetylglutamate kinase [Bacillus sp. Marseille-Q1617]|uniref:acetylglutamate kinase n=1 Tax=Bacillus sp. Marseille-Q1617 TaxID=2736887 RepID=UPI0020CA62BB|nr:acetylglutamate kinase [Bacillus sp. Marseille-Q1617]